VVRTTAMPHCRARGSREHVHLGLPARVRTRRWVRPPDCQAAAPACSPS